MQEDIASLLRFESFKTDSGKSISLSEYVKQMKPDQKHIYYYSAPRYLYKNHKILNYIINEFFFYDKVENWH